MKSERIYKALGNVDENLLLRHDENVEKARTRKNVWVRYGSVAACLCIVAVGVFALGKTIPPDNNIVAGGETIPDADVGEINAEYILPDNYSLLLDNVIALSDVQSGEASDGTSESYDALHFPENGDWGYIMSVRNALEHYEGQDVTFFLGIDITQKEEGLWHPLTTTKTITANKDVLDDEIKRLGELGYKVDYYESWTYEVHQDFETGQSAIKKVLRTYIGGYFTAQEIKNFAASDDYGYVFFFPTTGDNDPAHIEEGVISFFDTSDALPDGTN